MSDESRRIANNPEDGREKNTSTEKNTETRSHRRGSENYLRLSPREFEYLQKIMSSYSDNAKTYNQVSMAALFLPIVFLQKVLGTSAGMADGGLVDSILGLNRIWAAVPTVGCQVFREGNGRLG